MPTHYADREYVAAAAICRRVLQYVHGGWAGGGRNVFFACHLSFVLGYWQSRMNIGTDSGRRDVVSHALMRYGGEKCAKVFLARGLRGGPRACIRVRYELV